MVNKKAVSLMLSYVILISIAIATSITIFTWLKLIANVEPLPSCGEGTSITLNEYECLGKFDLTIKNNGRFNVNGIILTVGGNPQRVPDTFLIPLESKGTSAGQYIFDPILSPGDTVIAKFTNDEIKDDGSVGDVTFLKIENIKIQLFTIDDKTGDKIFCESTIVQDIVDCRIT